MGKSNTIDEQAKEKVIAVYGQVQWDNDTSVRKMAAWYVKGWNDNNEIFQELHETIKRLNEQQLFFAEEIIRLKKLCGL